jgi:hypothetical protein
MRRMTFLVALASAFLVPQVASAIIPVAQLTLTFSNITQPVSGAYVGGQNLSVVGLATIPVGNSTQSIVIPDFGATSFELFGVYTNGSNQGLMMGVDTVTAPALEGLTYDQAFPNAPVTEAQFIADLLNPPVGSSPPILSSDDPGVYYGDAGALSGQQSYVGIPGTADLVDFSTGALNGTVVITTSVPEPASIGILGIATLALVWRRRVRS